jgi:hypothetical protein
MAATSPFAALSLADLRAAANLRIDLPAGGRFGLRAGRVPRTAGSTVMNWLRCCDHDRRDAGVKRDVIDRDVNQRLTSVR